MAPAYISGVGTTPFGCLPHRSALDLMAHAAQEALDDARMDRSQIDGLLCGYALTLPHVMLSTLFSERFALAPSFAQTLQLGGATGGAMIMTARELVRSGACRSVLVVAGENRLSGQSRDDSIQALAQVGDVESEVPNGGSVPAYYALMASAYMNETGLSEADLAEFAVLMRGNAKRHPQAHLREAITVADVLASKPVATPLKLLDCCPISDGAAALIITADCPGDAPIEIVGAGQAHRHQHLSAWRDLRVSGAGEAARRALDGAGLSLSEINYLAVYDSFTITLAMLLEEIGFAPRGESADRLKDGAFSVEGPHPLNTHGGLLSFGHCGVAGGMAHAVEAYRQLADKAGARQVQRASHALVHADGGVMSSHVSLVLARAR